jgi:hypothetical protein
VAAHGRLLDFSFMCIPPRASPRERPELPCLVAPGAGCLWIDGACSIYVNKLSTIVGCHQLTGSI